MITTEVLIKSGIGNHLEMFVAGIFGILIHAFIKISKINKSLQYTNYKDVFKQYFKIEWTTLALSLIVVSASVFVADEILTSDEKDVTKILPMLMYNVSQFIKITFIAIGFSANSIVYSLFGKVDKRLRSFEDNENKDK